MTERQSDRAATRDIETQLLRLLLHQMPGILWTVDTELQFTSSLGAGLPSLGLQPNQVVGMDLFEYFQTDDPDLMPIAAHRAALRGEESSYEFSWEDRAFQCHVEPFRDRAGEITGAIGIAFDITDRKRTEETLRKEKEFSDAATGSLPGLFYLFDDRGQFLRWNRNFERLSGYSPREIAAMNPLDFFTGEDRNTIERSIREVFQKGYTTAEVDLVSRDGDTTPYFFTGTLVTFDDKRCVVGTAIDLVERRRLEHQLRQAQKMEAVGRLAGGIAHDFNNVLTVIISNSEMLLSGFGSDDPRRGEVEDIKGAAQRAATLTRQLLAFSRKQVLQPRVLNLNDVVANLEKMLARLIGEDVELMTLLEPDLWAVEADPGQMEQIIMNLAVNARDAMPEGGKLAIETGNVEVDESFTEKHYPMGAGHYVMLVVCDNGIGMDTETRAHIFEPFFSTKPRGKGTGLGLSMVYGIVKQSGGYIWAYSEPGAGTTFKIYMPRVDREAGKVETEPPRTSTARGDETVLLVEDEEAVRVLARRILKESGYKVLEAREPSEALEVCECYADPIHLLVTDVVMPEASGRELAEQLSALRPGVRVLYISGYTDHDMLQDVLEPGVNFLQKPFAPADLARKVRDVLDSRLRGG
jgi:PAS domain S-box-containing protein